MATDEVKIGYQEHSLDDVCQYFVGGFKPQPGVTIVGWEFFVDPMRKVVIFKMSMKKDDPGKILTLQ